MDKIRRYFELKEQWKRVSENERPSIDVEITALMHEMSDEDISRLTSAVQKDFDRIHKEADEIKKDLGTHTEALNLI